MKFERENRVTHPATTIVEVMIERMEDIAPFMSTVESIRTESREEMPEGLIHIVRRWQGSDDKAPAAIRPFLSKDLMAWRDDAVWTPHEFQVEWELSSSLGKIYRCSGINYFEPHPDDPKNETRIRITGELEVYPAEIPGIPKFFADRIGPQLERFIVGMITPDLAEVANGLQRYLDEQ